MRAITANDPNDFSHTFEFNANDFLVYEIDMDVTYLIYDNMNLGHVRDVVKEDDPDWYPPFYVLKKKKAQYLGPFI